MAEKHIELTPSDFQYVTTIGVLLIHPKIINFLIPDKPDKEGLYEFETLKKRFAKAYAGKGVFKSDKFYLMASPLFRRGHYASANFEPGFLNKFWNYKNSEVKAFIALDEDRVRIDARAGDYGEYDRWYGPPFNNDISKMPDDIVKLRPPGKYQVHLNSDFLAMLTR